MAGDDALRAAFDALLARFRERYEGAAILDAELSLSETSDHVWPPPPDSAHPGLTDLADTARAFIKRGEHAFRVARPEPITWQLAEPEPDPCPSMRDTVFNIHWAVGLAPYVGDPYVYVWRIAVDPSRRWVAGPAEQVSLA